MLTSTVASINTKMENSDSLHKIILEALQNKGSSSKLDSKAEEGEETWKTVVAVLLREIESFTMRYGIAGNLGAVCYSEFAASPVFPDCSHPFSAKVNKKGERKISGKKIYLPSFYRRRKNMDLMPGKNVPFI